VQSQYINRCNPTDCINRSLVAANKRHVVQCNRYSAITYTAYNIKATLYANADILIILLLTVQFTQGSIKMHSKIYSKLKCLQYIIYKTHIFYFILQCRSGLKKNGYTENVRFSIRTVISYVNYHFNIIYDIKMIVYSDLINKVCRLTILLSAFSFQSRPVSMQVKKHAVGLMTFGFICCTLLTIAKNF